MSSVRRVYLTVWQGLDRPMQKLTPDERRKIVDAIRNDMRAPLREVTRDNHVVLEFHAHIVSAQP